MMAQPLEPRLSRLEGAFEQIVERLGDTNARLETLDQKMELNFHALLTTMDTRFAAMDTRFSALERKFIALDDKFETKFTALDRKIDSRFQFLIGAYVTTTVALGGIFFAAIAPLYTHLPR